MAAVPEVARLGGPEKCAASRFITCCGQTFSDLDGENGPSVTEYRVSGKYLSQTMRYELHRDHDTPPSPPLSRANSRAYIVISYLYRGSLAENIQLGR